MEGWGAPRMVDQRSILPIIPFFSLILPSELGQFVSFLAQIVSKSSLFLGAQFATQLFSFPFQFVSALDHGLIFSHIPLLHRLVGLLKIIDIRVVTLNILIGRLAAEHGAGVAGCSRRRLRRRGCCVGRRLRRSRGSRA